MADDVEGRYRAIFELAPIALWEEDFTGAIATFDALRARGVTDFQQYFAEHPDVLAELARTIEIIDVNRMSVELFEARSKEHLLGSLDRVFIPETYPVFEQEMLAMASGNPYFAVEGVAGTLSGRRIHTYVTFTILPPHQGITRGLIGVLDISRRKQAEDQLAAQEKLYRTLIESIPHMIWMGDSRGKITYCNLAMREATGIDIGGSAGLDWTETIHPDDRQSILDVRAAAREQGKPYRGEYRYHAAYGSHRTVHFIDTPVTNDAGEVVSWVGVNTDITERKGAQEELQRSLERSNQELAQIAHAASHDLQEPLRMVTSYAELLDRRYGEQLGERASKYLGYMVEGATRISKLILDLLALSNIHIEGGELGETETSTVVSQVIDTLYEALVESGAEIITGELPRVMADRRQLAQLFRALFDNSLKFRSDDKPRIRLSARREGGMWQFAVQDNGMGFDSEEYGERIFEMFRRLHIRDEYSGTGIGLTIAKKIVERHGGRIWAESRPGAGATFFFTLSAVHVEMLDEGSNE